jgi:hypothetical protein
MALGRGLYIGLLRGSDHLVDGEPVLGAVQRLGSVETWLANLEGTAQWLVTWQC